MKTQKSLFAGIFLLGLAICALSLPAQRRAKVEPRPEQSDAASSQLLTNYLKVSGGADRHESLRNVVASGSIKESTLERRFNLVETSDGKRFIRYQWTHLGRPHEVTYAHDGLQSWKQELKPEKKHPVEIGGLKGHHFGEILWLIHPVTRPRSADFAFQYRGNAKVQERPAHLVRGFGKNNRPLWLYFDKESFLITRWGGLSLFGGTQEYKDYRATSFRRVDGLVFPSKIELLAENDAYGQIVIESLLTNQDLDGVSFLMPTTTTPTLRQRPVSRN